MSPISESDGFVLEHPEPGEPSRRVAMKRERGHKQYLRNKAKVLARNHLRYLSQRDKILSYSKDYYHRNRNIRLQQTAEWASRNRDKTRKANRDYYQRNLEEQRLRSRIKGAKEYAENHEYVVERNRKWRARNRGLIRVFDLRRKQRELQAVGNLKIMSEWMTGIRARKRVDCYYCGKSLKGKQVNFDHVIPLSRGGAHSVENLCCTCKSCNSSKYTHVPSEWKRVGQQTMDF